MRAEGAKKAPFVILNCLVLFSMFRLSFKIIIFISFIVFFFEACSSSARFTSKRNRNEETVKRSEDLSRYEDYPVLETETGTASFYADKYHGKIAYSGEVYDMNGISAAHPTYPMGTIIRVTNLENGKHVILRINDRMPQWPDRIIDLSLGTAKVLDFVNQGLTKVKIEVLEWGTGRK